MICIKRLPEPAILVERKELWLAAYLRRREEHSIRRPWSWQYAHPEIRNTLAAMSFRKCFYCEHKLAESDTEVDHYIEVAERPDLAFDWHNLYLSCSDCNRKKVKSDQIPTQDCLDPCDATENPADHLAFDDEMIRAKNGSERGLKTIQKYRLDRDELDHRRLKQLQVFNHLLRHIHMSQIQEGRETLTPHEQDLLLRFRQSDHAFSLMFDYYLSKVGL